MVNIINTVSFHIVKSCNARCKFCYATFEDFTLKNQMSLKDAKTIVDKLKIAGVKKITFAGGEPTIYKNLFDIVKYTHESGIITSIITNGSLITEEWLDKYKPYLRWIGLSVDSINCETNLKIGRVFKNPVDYFKLICLLKQYEFKIKINTVINKYNENEDLQEFINFVNPDRWKVFDTLRIVGQNDEHWEEIKSTNFKAFIDRHYHPNMVVETNDLMTSSYLLIDPQGRLFENSKGFHTYSSSTLIEETFESCYKELNFSYGKFIQREGIYNF